MKLDARHIPGGNTARGRLGRFGEDIAVAFLSAAGYRILERNWRCARGEIDIVAAIDHVVVFVEVKTRSGLGFGHPVESITPIKLARLRTLAYAWRRAHPDVSGAMRIDAIGVIAPHAAPYEITHLTGVFA